MCQKIFFKRRAPRRLLCVGLAFVLLILSAISLPCTAAGFPTDKGIARLPAMSGGICLPAGDANLPAVPSISARGAVLMEANSGDIVLGQNQHARLPMASTTKIMTALVAIEEISPDTTITISPEAVGIEGSSIYLIAGERLTMKELLYALMLESANDAAAAIAIAVAGSVEEFSVLMNQKAEALGLTDTHFVNPHGLDNPEHYTTAAELATITREALKNPLFREICFTARKSIPLHGKQGGRLLINHNKLLSSYDGCIGVKTGFTKKTGRCLVSVAERDGVTLIAVTLNAPDDWRDHTAMLDYGFETYQAVTLCEPGFYAAPLWTVSGTRDYVMVENSEILTAVLRRDHGPVRCIVELPHFVFAPVQAGDAVGRLIFFEERADRTRTALGVVSLHAAFGSEAVVYKPSLWEWITALFSG